MNQEVANKQTNREPTVERAESGTWYRPNVDIFEQAERLVLKADMPGLGTDQIDIRFEDGTLTLHGRVPQRIGSGTQFLLQEYGVGDYFRSFKLNETIDAGKISAEYVNGVLTLELPKVESVRPRRIPVAVR